MTRGLKYFKPTCLLISFCLLGYYSLFSQNRYQVSDCEQRLLDGDFLEAEQCLQSTKPEKMLPAHGDCVIWLELQLQFLMQERDIQGTTDTLALKYYVDIAQAWLGEPALSTSSKQQLAYLVYLYHTGKLELGFFKDFPPFAFYHSLSPLSNRPNLWVNLLPLTLILILVLLLVYRFFWLRKPIEPHQKSPLKEEQLLLQQHVEERTQELARQYLRLQDYSYANSHMIRAPLARLLGLVELMEQEPLTADGRFYMKNITKSCEELDHWILKMNTILDTEIDTPYEREKA